MPGESTTGWPLTHLPSFDPDSGDLHVIVEPPEG